MEQYLIEHPWIFILLMLWILPWKGVALWRSAKLDKKAWFISFLVINTLGILEILYIFVFSKTNKPQDTSLNQL